MSWFFVCWCIFRKAKSYFNNYELGMVEKGWGFRDHGTWWIEQIDWMIFVYWEWWISIEATKICYFGLALSGIGSQPTRLSDVLNLKNLKTIWGIKLIFCFHWSYKKDQTIFGYAGKYSWPISLQIFTFDLFGLLILIPGIYCYIALVL